MKKDRRTNKGGKSNKGKRKCSLTARGGLLERGEGRKGWDY